MITAGIDLSINGTGIAVSNGNYYFQTPLKKLPQKLNHPNIFADTSIGFSKKENHKRYYQNASKIINFLLNNQVTKIGIENYAYGYGHESPGLVFDIAEFTGTVKCLLVHNNIEIIRFAPTEIKKAFTSSGNASKVIMVEKYFKLNLESPLNHIINDLKINKYSNPINDLVDAFAILQMIVWYSN